MEAIPRRERLIVALDVPSAADARKLVEELGDSVCFYKIGLELSTSGGYFELLDWLVKRGNRVFCDLKLHDIPETVRRAVANLRGRGATFLTVHADRGVMGAAVKEKGEMKILAVTVLTSTSQADLAEQGYAGRLEDLVLTRARAAAELGCDGVVTSGLEVSGIKAKFGARLLAVTPGIRPAGGEAEDQKRVVDAAEAFKNGADYIVVGRPVRDTSYPAAAAQAIQATIAEIFPLVIQGLAGIAGLLLLAWIFSEKRGVVPWRAIWAGLLLQFLLALLLLKLPFAEEGFFYLNEVLSSIEKATQAGTALVFGYLGGGAAPFAVTNGNANFILAFRALPIVLVVSALSALLFHWGVLQRVVRVISWLLERSMRVGGVVGLSTAANVFVGMVEAPLFVRPYLGRVSRGELFAIMVGGMASIAGTVLFLYASILGPILPNAVAHLLIASIVSAPAALVVAFVMVPPEGTATGGNLDLRSEATSSMDALTQGTLGGAQLLINIIAMLVVFVALVTLVNLGLEGLPHGGRAPYTLQGMLGWVLAPLAWLAGVPWAEAHTGGMLLGTKTVLNELIAYIDMANMPSLSDRSRLIMTYALCGFANFGSLGIMIGGMSTMCPERRAEIVSLGMKSIVAGTLATCLTAATVGLIV